VWLSRGFRCTLRYARKGGWGCNRYRPLEENPRYNLESTGSLPEPSGASLEMALIFFGSGDCPPGPERLPVLED
jgi:hypothetical protein